MPEYRFGKLPAKLDYRTLRFKDYVTPQLAPPPPTFNVLTRVYVNLKTNDPTTLFPMDGNDTLSDCTIAALAHATTTFNGLLGTKNIMARTDVVKLYTQLTGGQDSGLPELDVLNYWRKHSVDSEKILAYVAIDPKNHTNIQQAIRLFGGVYLGFQVQQDCQKDFQARKPWSPGTLTRDGHAVVAIAYDETGVTVLTWGNTQQATWAWWDECVDEAYALLPQQAKDPKFAPGFNCAQLQKDLATVATN